VYCIKLIILDVAGAFSCKVTIEIYTTVNSFRQSNKKVQTLEIATDMDYGHYTKILV